MTELEKYITANREEFNFSPVPDGSRDRFMASVAAEKRRSRIRIISMVSTGIAACMAAVLFLTAESDMSKVLERHHSRLTAKELDIITLTESEHPYEIEEILNSIRSITFEAIPLEDQLPDELSERQKIKILNGYYNQKYEALESLMAQL